VTLSLTAQGKKLWRQTMSLIEERNQSIFACLSPAERNTLSALLDRLIAHNNPNQVIES
jgi:DNA-binding MarR family transcriptional regulator